MGQHTFDQRVAAAAGAPTLYIDPASTGQLDDIVLVSNATLFFNAITKITGFAGGVDGRTIAIISLYPYELANDDAASAVGNRIVVRSNTSRKVGSLETIRLSYSAAFGAWAEEYRDLQFLDHFPSIYTDLNVTAVSFSKLRIIRISDEIRIVGTILATPLAAGKIQIGISNPLALPVTFAAADDITGIAQADEGSTIVNGVIAADTVQNRAQLTAYAPSTNPLVFAVDYRYKFK